MCRKTQFKSKQLFQADLSKKEQNMHDSRSKNETTKASLETTLKVQFNKNIFLWAGV